MPAPLPPVTLEDKQKVTRLLMSSGASIQELNCVRKQISQVKGGRLAEAATCGTLITLIISDVVGDPLDIIASGPTVNDSSTTQEAIEILRRLVKDPQQIPDSIWDVLISGQSASKLQRNSVKTTVINKIIGNNVTALEAAQQHRGRDNYQSLSMGSENEGTAVRHRCGTR